jgi:hypothetical protein
MMRKVLVVFEALEHAFPVPWKLFVTLRGRIFATLAGGTILTII